MGWYFQSTQISVTMFVHLLSSSFRSLYNFLTESCFSVKA